MGESKKRKRRGSQKGKEEKQTIPSPSAKRTKLKESSTFLEKVLHNQNTTFYLINLCFFFLGLMRIVCLSQMRARLSGGHFRMINEKLYTCTYVLWFLQFQCFCEPWNLDYLLSVGCYVVSCLFSGKEALDYFQEEPSLFNMVRAVLIYIL